MLFDLNISVREYTRIVHNYNQRYHIEKKLCTSCPDLS